MKPLSVNPPSGALFHEDVSLLVWHPEGVISEASVNQVIAYLGELEVRRNLPFNRFTDTRQAEAIGLNFHYIFHISLFRRLAYHGPPILSAVLTSDETLKRYFKMHALLTQGSAIKVRLFETTEAAAEWLGVQVALLETNRDPGTT